MLYVDAYLLESRLKYIISNDVSSKIQQTVEHAGRSTIFIAIAQCFLETRMTRMDDGDQCYAKNCVRHGCAEEVDKRAYCNTAVEFGVEACATCHQAGDDQRQDDQLQEAHEQFTGV